MKLSGVSLGQTEMGHLLLALGGYTATKKAESDADPDNANKYSYYLVSARMTQGFQMFLEQYMAAEAPEGTPVIIINPGV